MLKITSKKLIGTSKMLNLFSKFNCRMTSQLIALNLKHMVLLAYLDTLKSG